MADEDISTAYLLIQRGPQAGKRVELWKDITTIGRSRHCDIFLEDITVHRKQASIIFTPMGFVLRDDNGSGDSFVNGRPVSEQVLRDGDHLLFGTTELIFFAHEGTRPFQLATSRGRELHRGKKQDPNTSTIARLEIGSLHGTTRRFDLQPETSIGRSRDCSIFLEDLTVSRVHAIIRLLPDGTYEIEDQGSATGTFVNNMAIQRYRLIEGDVIQIGASCFTFRRSRS
ncbi:MAG TPA: FHA domain-containing protein [Ktedonobacteraceae bacterium]|nr:FHA domain-containing protein [Ktedonobacteraceae bacterium]